MASEIERKYEVPADFAVDEPARRRRAHPRRARACTSCVADLLRHRRPAAGRGPGGAAPAHRRAPTPAGTSSATAAARTATSCSCRWAAPRAVPAAVTAEVRAVSRGEPAAPDGDDRPPATEWPLLGPGRHACSRWSPTTRCATELIADPAAAQRWRELEVELVEGDRDAAARGRQACCARRARPARPTRPRSPARWTAAGRPHDPARGPAGQRRGGGRRVRAGAAGRDRAARPAGPPGRAGRGAQDAGRDPPAAQHAARRSGRCGTGPPPTTCGPS